MEKYTFSDVVDEKELFSLFNGLGNIDRKKVTLFNSIKYFFIAVAIACIGGCVSTEKKESVKLSRITRVFNSWKRYMGRNGSGAFAVDCQV